MKNNNHSQILFLTKKGGNYGMGHHKRMSLLKEKFESHKIPVTLSVNETQLRQASQFKVIVLDSRDEGFPEKLVSNKSPEQYFISVDNRGKGRLQADIVWDTLPHYNMTRQELEYALNRCIISPDLLSYKKEVKKFNIVKTTLKEIQNNMEIIDLIQDQTTKRKSSQSFYKNLVSSKSIAVYFGQTFFEALFLGKTVYLYDISAYHKKLSDWFITRATENPGLAKYLDGKGLDRFFELVISKLEES